MSDLKIIPWSVFEVCVKGSGMKASLEAPIFMSLTQNLLPQLIANLLAQGHA